MSALNLYKNKIERGRYEMKIISFHLLNVVKFLIFFEKYDKIKENKITKKEKCSL